ncbi:hypothetical protein J6590_068879 [Homalodisca vitripennis]|nr:hypothetical protein J6590_068879 [Homalodisca vitripennis]
MIETMVAGGQQALETNNDETMYYDYYPPDYQHYPGQGSPDLVYDYGRSRSSPQRIRGNVSSYQSSVYKSILANIDISMFVNTRTLRLANIGRSARPNVRELAVVQETPRWRPCCGVDYTTRATSSSGVRGHSHLAYVRLVSKYCVASCSPVLTKFCIVEYTTRATSSPGVRGHSNLAYVRLVRVRGHSHLAYVRLVSKYCVASCSPVLTKFYTVEYTTRATSSPGVRGHSNLAYVRLVSKYCVASCSPVLTKFYIVDYTTRATSSRGVRGHSHLAYVRLVSKYCVASCSPVLTKFYIVDYTTRATSSPGVRGHSHLAYVRLSSADEILYRGLHNTCHVITTRLRGFHTWRTWGFADEILYRELHNTCHVITRGSRAFTPGVCEACHSVPWTTQYVPRHHHAFERLSHMAFVGLVSKHCVVSCSPAPAKLRAVDYITRVMSSPGVCGYLPLWGFKSGGLTDLEMALTLWRRPPPVYCGLENMRPEPPCQLDPITRDCMSVFLRLLTFQARASLSTFQGQMFGIRQ